MPDVNIIGGATLWARQTTESDIFIDKPDKWFKIWFYLVNRVCYENTKRYKRGEIFLKYEYISETTKATFNQIDSFIRWAKQCKMLTTRKTTHGMIVKITNYSKFQTLDNYYFKIKTDTETETEPKQNRDYNEEYNKIYKYITPVGVSIINSEKEKTKADKDIGLKKTATSKEAELIQYWSDKWEKSFHRKPVITNWGRYVKQAKPFIKEYNLEKCKKICDIYFITSNKFYQDNKWSLGLFLTDNVFNKLV